MAHVFYNRNSKLALEGGVNIVPVGSEVGFYPNTYEHQFAKKAALKGKVLFQDRMISFWPELTRYYLTRFDQLDLPYYAVRFDGSQILVPMALSINLRFGLFGCGGHVDEVHSVINVIMANSLVSSEEVNIFGIQLEHPKVYAFWSMPMHVFPEARKNQEVALSEN